MPIKAFNDQLNGEVDRVVHVLHGIEQTRTKDRQEIKSTLLELLEPAHHSEGSPRMQYHLD